MKNKIKNLFKILTVTAGCLMFASFSPSLDGRAVVVDKGVFPQGLFAKTVGYLPGDVISVTNIAGDATVEILVIGALDPSEGVAIMLSPEAAEAMGIDSSANNIVKITKRSGQDDRVFGNAVISKSAADIKDFDDDDFESIGAEQNSEAFDNTNEEPEELEETEEEETIEEEAAEEPEEAEEAEEEFAEEQEAESVPEEVEEPAEEEDFEEEAIEDEESDEVEEDFEEETPEEEAPAEDTVESEEEAFEDETPDELEESADEEAFEDEEPDALPAEEEAVEEEPEAFEEEEADSEVEEEAPAEEETEEDMPAEEGFAEEAFDEEALDALPAEETEETEEPEEDIPSEEAFEADELDDLPAESKSDEYEAIVLVPADSNPPENEDDEVEDVISEDDIDAIDAIDAIDEEITLTPLVEEKAAEPEQPKPSAKAETSYDKYMVPSLKNLESGKYYIQIAVYSSEENILDVINKYGTNYPITIVPMAGGTSKQILIGPVTMDEYKVVLERFKSYGFKDAFLRKVR